MTVPALGRCRLRTRGPDARHRRTRGYRPQTNGKAERFIQTLLRECAYAVPYPNSRVRIQALRRWVTH